MFSCWFDPNWFGFTVFICSPSVFTRVRQAHRQQGAEQDAHPGNNAVLRQELFLDKLGWNVMSQQSKEQRTEHTSLRNSSDLFVSGGNCSPHHRGTPRFLRWDSTASRTANQSRCSQTRRRRRRTALKMPAFLRSRPGRGESRRRLRTSVLWPAWRWGRRRRPRRRLTAPTLPLRPARSVGPDGEQRGSG